MAFRKGVHAFRGVTLSTEFFSLFFSHLLEPAVNWVFGQFFRSLFRGVEQESENSATGEDEGDIYEQRLDSFVGCRGHGFLRSGC